MSIAQLTLSATARPLAMRMRADLEFQSVYLRGRPQWVVKDPLAWRFYQLREEEFFVLQLLDGQASIDQIQARFERQFAPRRLDARRLHAFLARLHEDGLIVSDLPGQGAELNRRRSKLARRKAFEAFANVLAIRFRGVDPDPFLRRLEPACRWMFSRWFAAACGLVVGAALWLVIAHFDTLRARLPEFRDFLGAGNLLWLAVAIATAKVLHEMGHAVACQHYGGRCHELGLMLLVFTPCLYCNVSDAWMFADRWRRIAVSAAGMAVEIVLAALATFAWWWSQPGPLNSLALDLMIVCSISTLAINGNPLLRYDGYYILADLTETPNLQERSTGIVRRWLARWAFGIDLPDDRLLPECGRGWLAAYAVAAAVYRVLVVATILWCLHEALSPRGLDMLTTIVGLTVIGSIVGIPMFRGGRWLRDQSRQEPIRWGRFVLRGELVITVVAILLAIPFPYRVTAPLALEPAGATRIYVTAPGRLIEAVAAGTVVEKGQTLARLRDPVLDLEIARLDGEFREQELHVQNLERQQGADPVAAAQIPTAREALADLRERLARRREDQKRLTLVAPRSGTVLPPPRRPADSPPGLLPDWSDTPLEPRNRGAYLETGTLVCLIGDPSDLEAAAAVDQADIDFVRPGQRARIELDEQPGDTIWGTVEAVAQREAQIAPHELAARGEVATRADSAGAPRPLEVFYEARLSLDPHAVPLRAGGLGRVKISADPQSLGRRLLRFLDRTFQIKW